MSPNPVVGAVIVGAAGDVLGEGWHAAYGGLHAERAALAGCAERDCDPRGATMYVSLEPCAHTGRQPPCVDAILEAGIARVVIAADDPSAKAAGAGPAALREGGVEVSFADIAAKGDEIAAEAGGDLATELGEIARRARLANQAFRKHARTGRPLVVLKLASSLDGRIATPSGESRWISSPASRALGHRWRCELDAVAVGIGTVLADDPSLTARPDDERDAAGESDIAGAASGPDLPPLTPGWRQPLRVVFDSAARTPPGARVLGADDGDDPGAPALIVIGPSAPAERVEAILAAGAGVFATGLTHDREPAPAAEPRVDLRVALDELGARGVTSILLEGGAHLAGAFLEAGEVDEIRLFVAPLVLGAGPAAVEGAGHEALDDALRAPALECVPSGPDVLITARLAEW